MTTPDGPQRADGEPRLDGGRVQETSVGRG